MYTHRFYRSWTTNPELHRFEVKIAQSDLCIACDLPLEDLARDELTRVRTHIESYARTDLEFLSTTSPYPVRDSAPEPVIAMARAAYQWSVGPMAAVAGVIAQCVAEALLTRCTSVIVENGGDVFVKATKPVRFTLYAGERSPFTDRIAFEVDAREGLGVCTSSSIVGPSLSFGNADAVVAMATDAAYADAAATALANRIKTANDIDKLLADEKNRKALTGVIACIDDKIGFWGDFKLLPQAQVGRCA